MSLLKNLEQNVFKDRIDLSLFSILISSNLDKIRVEYKNNGKSQAFFLIDSYIANDNNLNYILEKARIYFKENDFVEAENIFEERL